MRMDMVVTFGNVLEIAAIIGGVFVAYSKLKERLVAIETRLEPLWKDYTDGQSERRQFPRRLQDRDA